MQKCKNWSDGESGSECSFNMNIVPAFRTASLSQLSWMHDGRRTADISLSKNILHNIAEALTDFLKSNFLKATSKTHILPCEVQKIMLSSKPVLDCSFNNGNCFSCV